MTVTVERRATTAMQPVLGPLAEGDLCDMTSPTRVGRRRYCHQPAVREAIDADGRTRLLCAECVDRYFPASTVAGS